MVLDPCAAKPRRPDALPLLPLLPGPAESGGARQAAAAGAGAAPWAGGRSQQVARLAQVRHRPLQTLAQLAPLDTWPRAWHSSAAPFPPPPLRTGQRRPRRLVRQPRQRLRRPASAPGRAGRVRPHGVGCGCAANGLAGAPALAAWRSSGQLRCAGGAALRPAVVQRGCPAGSQAPASGVAAARCSRRSCSACPTWAARASAAGARWMCPACRRSPRAAARPSSRSRPGTSGRRPAGAAAGAGPRSWRSRLLQPCPPALSTRGRPCCSCCAAGAC
jgi:hypothetical protein